MPRDTSKSRSRVARTNDDAEPSKPKKRSVTYLRVSTKEQAVRDGNREGYSLPTQRAEAQRKADILDSDLVEEYLDKDTGTRTDKRPAMQALLERIRTQRDIDYVIVFKLDRWARNAREDLVNDYILEMAGAELVSCSEAIDRSNSGRMMHTVLAANNEYHSRNMGDEIKRKTLIKIKDGGTHGQARLGYKNVGEGGKRWVDIDPEPFELIRWCFMTYATGEWSVKNLLAEATARGLLSRGGPNTPRKPLSVSQMHRTLASPYYKGIVVFNGVEYEGKHQRLIDPETWQRVQDLLASKVSGEKQREHPHYLKGTIFCGHCGSRLCVTHSRGKLGKIYPYYFCVGRQQKRTTCMLKARPIEVVEEQIADQYHQLQLTSQGLEAVAEAVLAELETKQVDAADRRERDELRLKQLDAERLKLLQAHYAGAVPLDLLRAEQQRIGQELVMIQAALEVTTASAERLKATADAAVTLATDCHCSYLNAPNRDRRLMNQAFFRAIWVTEEGVVGWEYNEPFATLLHAHGAPEPRLIAEYEPDAKTQAEDSFETDEQSLRRRSPGRWVRAVFCQGSKANHLAEGVGFEPTEGFPSRLFKCDPGGPASGIQWT